MDHPYDPSSVEKKWQAKWKEAGLHKADLKKAKHPYYALAMFPYPSGDKLHVGHWYNFAPADSSARYQRMKGKDVFEPMGFDAFGLPAENYAIKTGVPPQESIKKNVGTMIEQLSRIGAMYDWDRTLNTSDPLYYKWTQWLFLKMYEHKLAYKKEALVNWCPKDQTVLANEQVKDGQCERCGTEVVQKTLNQWFWNTKKYAQQLLDGLDGLDWPEKTKAMQRNWIDRSEGVNFTMKVKGMPIEFEVYDSIPQTFKAQTFVVIAPEHPLVAELVKGTDKEKEVMHFVDDMRKKKAAKRFEFDEDMAGVDTGRVVQDPFGTGDLPLWVASFVVMEYGTGIVSCSAHDERDFAFAKAYKLPLRPVMFPADPVEAERVRNLEVCYTKDPEGVLQEPKEFAGRHWGEVRRDIIDFIEKEKIGKRQVNYRLRDWTISRQRYWGAPIPVVYDPAGQAHPVPEEHLPWMLPTDVEFKPTGESPLRLSVEFKARTEKLFGKGWTPEYDTMDTFVCSSFYFLRYLMEGDTETFIDPALEKKWLPTAMYIGGPEHACMHLIYARFVMLALRDMGIVSHGEPFQRLVHQGLITAGGAKMSKSKGNVVSPDSFVDYHGADVFRMYLMFMGPFTDGGDWSDTGIKGVERFVQRAWKLLAGPTIADKHEDSPAARTALHKAIKSVSDSLEGLRFNTAISALMELLNSLESETALSREIARTFTLLLAPLAPHLADELWERLGGEGFVVQQSWPTFDPAFLKSDTLAIAVQVNGKLRGQVDVPAAATSEEVIAAAKAEPNVAKFLADQAIKKEIYVPGRLVSFVV
ncbi:MAG: leucine--tRNA ligase [Candidatus Peribacteraceae bacterium]|nr:leucine--tRNA ligase [Candidatus Peribacteraceae bacterium]